MPIRRVQCRRPHSFSPPATRTLPLRPTVTKTAPSVSKSVYVQHAPSKPLQAYQMVTLPCVEILHQNFTEHGPTQAIVEDPHLAKQELIPQVLINFANREMLQGMIKVELTLMLWSYKSIKLPDDVTKLVIDNLTDSLSKSAINKQREYFRELFQKKTGELMLQFNLNKKPI